MSQTMSKTVSGKAKNTANGRYSKVMLIDDNSLDNFINKKLLESNGFTDETEAFESAEKALEKLKSSATDELPDVIFLDIMMPGMDGFQFLEAFENLPTCTQQHCRVIMLSTSESFKDLNRANKNRFVKKFLNKPLTSETINAIHV